MRAMTTTLLLPSLEAEHSLFTFFAWRQIRLDARELPVVRGRAAARPLQAEAFLHSFSRNPSNRPSQGQAVVGSGRSVWVEAAALAVCSVKGGGLLPEPPP